MNKNFSTNFSTKVSLRTAAYFERLKLTEHTFMIIVAIIIGMLAGFSAIGIRFLIKEISLLSFQGAGTFLENVLNTSWYWILIIPAVGGLIVGPIIYYLAPEAKGHGVPEVMQAILLKGGNIRPRVAFIKAIASSISIGTGGSVGREGPIIQIGSSIGSMIGQFLRVPSKRLKTLVGCGAAAGIAAAFNAPIAGALFAVEIILMDFAIAQFSPIVIASVMATVVSHTFEGKFAAFMVPKYQLVSPQEIGFYFVLGALAGVVSYFFIKLLYWCEDLFDNKMKLPEYVNPAIGGVIVGIVALGFPQVMGVGYDTINMALYGKMVWYIAVVLIFAKILATSVTLGSGGSGGIFAPSLFMGAMLGYFFGYAVHSLFPNVTASPGAYALVAMGGLVAGTTRAPITAIIIVFELTNDYSIILPLMVTCIISLILSSRLTRESIYT
ncbi:MAG: chloride channel protein, partial [Ignavibacteriaceae bacterium]|nr:chloride channel protein [Ignavibacteriaceae bacterium]